MADMSLNCRDCGKEFIFSDRDQAFFAEKGWNNQPTRCRDCARAKRNTMDAPRQMFPAVCMVCNQNCEVPFEPRGDKGVKCLNCFRASQA